MSMNRLFMGLAGLGLYLGTVTAASGVYCVALGTIRPPVRLSIEVGRVVVFPELPVGAVITKRTWAVSKNYPNHGQFSCSKGATFLANVIGPDITHVGNKIYATNLQGIGLRFTQKNPTGGGGYPFEYVTPKKGIYDLITGSIFSIELIKIAEITESGSVTSGQYTTFGVENTPVLITELVTNGLVVLSPSCQITTGRNQAVYLESIQRQQLTHPGDTAGETAFPIKLLCSGGDRLRPVNINITFDGDIASGTLLSNAVLANKLTGETGARGVGIQIRDKNKIPVTFKQSYRIGQLDHFHQKVIELTYYARYYQYARKITPGEVKAQMVFNINYD